MASNSDVILSVQGLRISDPRSGIQLLTIDSLEVRKGEILGLVGPSGSGKTLTALTLMGLIREQGLRVDAGRVIVDGFDMLSASSEFLDRLRGKRISMAFQEPASALDPVRRCGDQLEEALRKTGATRDERRRVISASLERVGLKATNRILRAFPRAGLSGGERQRVLLALAMLQNPGILVADEPTTALDPILRLEFANLLTHMRKHNQLSGIVISHDLDLIRHVADRVLTLDQGRLIDTCHGASHPVVHAPPLRQVDRPLVLSVRNLEKSYGRGPHRFVALGKVSFDLYEGEGLGVIGGSGAGKTTLARLIAGLEPADAGNIELRRVAGEPRQAAMQMIFQDPSASLDPLLSAGESVAETFTGSASTEEARAEIAKLFTAVGLSPALAARRPRELSGGQCQRVAIARAMAPGPRLIIADEPTTALDGSAAEQVIKALVHLRSQRRDIAYVMISHDLDLIAATCERLVVLDAGRIVESGSTATILSAPSSTEAVRLTEAWKAMRPARLESGV